MLLLLEMFSALSTRVSSVIVRALLLTFRKLVNGRHVYEAEVTRAGRIYGFLNREEVIEAWCNGGWLQTYVVCAIIDADPCHEQRVRRGPWGPFRTRSKVREELLLGLPQLHARDGIAAYSIVIDE